MLNELRTLLGNKLTSSALGEELIDAAFTVFPFSSEVEKIRKLFGLAEDGTTSNFSLAQITRAVHQPDLKPLLASFDPRITYDPFSNFWFDQIATKPDVVSSYSGLANFANTRIQVDLLKLSDIFQPPITRTYLVEYRNSGQVAVYVGSLATDYDVVLDLTGTGNWIWLDENFLRFRIVTDLPMLTPYFRFSVDYINYAAYNLTSLVANLKKDHEVALSEWAVRYSIPGAMEIFRNGGSLLDKAGAAAIITATRMKNEYGAI